MSKLDREAEKIMIERFGKDTIIALATVVNEVPYVRYVNAYYAVHFTERGPLSYACYGTFNKGTKRNGQSKWIAFLFELLRG